MTDEEFKKFTDKHIVQPNLTKEQISAINELLRKCKNTALKEDTISHQLHTLIKETLLSKYGLSSYFVEYTNLLVENLDELSFKIKLLELLNNACKDEML